jgi:F-type H+-transporting ATPase subunit alpha
VVLGDYEHLREGDTAKTTGRILEVPTGPELLGRVVNALGEPIDGKGPINAKAHRAGREGRAGRDLAQVGVAAGADRLQVGRLDDPDRPRPARADHRRPPDRQDRDGHRRDHQPEGHSGIKCIYVAIGQKNSTIANVVRKLEENGAMAYTTSSPHRRRIGRDAVHRAYSGCTMGEYFRDRGEDALIIYDDLSKQAVAYRQISLLLRRPPGREAYPGDVFYLHSRLLERAARVSEEYVEKFTNGAVKGKTGSLTALPIIETQAGDVSAFVPTNVISITDGQIFLETDLFNAGIRPAVNAGISVSRVGGAAQTKIIKKLSGGIRISRSRSTASWRRSRSSPPTSTRPRASSSSAASASPN